MKLGWIYASCELWTNSRNIYICIDISTDYTKENSRNQYTGNIYVYSMYKYMHRDLFAPQQLLVITHPRYISHGIITSDYAS